MVNEVGDAALVGWRRQLAQQVAPAVSRRTSFGQDDVRRAIGGFFFALSLYHVVGTLRRAIANERARR
jgi:hypothetical protein